MSNQYGRISFTDADAVERGVTLALERRHQFVRRLHRDEPEKLS